MDYTTDGGATWLPSAPSDLSTVNGVRSRGSITATTSGSGDALGVSNEASQWFTTNASSSFNASSSGDGWSTFFDETRVFNIHHHNGPNSIDCHDLSDGTVCPGFPIRFTGAGYYYNTSSRPDGWVDLSNHHLWFPTSNSDHRTGRLRLPRRVDRRPRADAPPRSSPSRATAPSRTTRSTSPTSVRFCTPRTARPASCSASTPRPTGGSGAACADQPYAGFAAGDNSGALISVGSNVYAYQDGEGHDHLLRHARPMLACAGWTSADGEQPADSARPFLAVPNGSGAVVALCLNSPDGWVYDPETDSSTWVPAMLQCSSVIDGSTWTPEREPRSRVTANPPDLLRHLLRQRTDRRHQDVLAGQQ